MLFSKACSVWGAATVVCGSLNSGGYGTLNHYDLCDFAQAYGVINASWLRKFYVPSSNQSGKIKKAWFLDHSLWFSKPNTDPEKARTSYKSCVYFSDRLKASWIHCVDRLQAKIRNSQKINILQ